MKTNEAVTRLPARLESFGMVGWTVFEFDTATLAAEWFTANPRAAMPCWKRMDVVGGELRLAR
jgi:hypothetical protein